MPLIFPYSALSRWYDTSGRKNLPWRNTSDAYAIWVSEIMLQQTQVATVKERYYPFFLERFPTVKALAEASLDEVLKSWEGLGYYTRARNLHTSATLCGSALPDSVEGLLALPGIGRNTAHAIAVFAYRMPVAVMEANVKRVLHRLYAKERLSEAQLWELAGTLVDKKDPFTYNQAMMDIGALLCTPRAPQCSACPLSVACQGKSEPERYPAAKVKKAIPVRKRRIILILDSNGKLFSKARETNFLGGLYGFVEEDSAPRNITFLSHRFPAHKAENLGQVSHTYSHFRLEAEILLLRLPDAQYGTDWKTQEEIALLPLSRADVKAYSLFTQWREEQAAAKKNAGEHIPPRPRKASQEAHQAVSG